MEEKTIADWEMDKIGLTSKSIEKGLRIRLRSPIWDAHCSRSNKEVVMAFTGKICGEGVPEIQHEKFKTDRLETTDKLQVIWKSMFKIKSREG